jgi:hypothetical protein
MIPLGFYMKKFVDSHLRWWWCEMAFSIQRKEKKIGVKNKKTLTLTWMNFFVCFCNMKDDKNDNFHKSLKLSSFLSRFFFQTYGQCDIAWLSFYCNKNRKKKFKLSFTKRIYHVLSIQKHHHPFYLVLISSTSRLKYHFHIFAIYSKAES